MSISIILGALLASAIAVITAYFKGTAAGRNSEIVERTKKDDALRTAYDRIDARKPDLDDAIVQLRKRAGADDGTPSQ